MSESLTDRQILADFAANYDLPKIVLRAHEQLITCGVRNGIASVLIRRFRTQDLATELRYTATGKLMRMWQQDPISGWVELLQIMVWESEFAPIRVAVWPRPTAAEKRAKRAWEDDCYRPGSDRHPQDNFERTALLGGDAAPAMRKHYGIGA